MWTLMRSMRSARWFGLGSMRTSLWPYSNGGCRLFRASRSRPQISAGFCGRTRAEISNRRQGLIAINYPARAFGLARHVTPTEAKKLCPDIILQHVATWREGDEKWAYRDDAASNIATDKVSLDPYRLESRRILKCIKEALPEKYRKVEKASIDEVFMDLSAQIHATLLERYEELRGPAPYDDPTELLPLPPTTAYVTL